MTTATPRSGHRPTSTVHVRIAVEAALKLARDAALDGCVEKLRGALAELDTVAGGRDGA
ncbi:hypothetical protein [Caenispirillum bisanense]|uniref:Uncharacterized protein n=1 Tax=Caenispirillum bisanense TaxID=414052 RepID=A0A286GUS1_9PROT|nr:hypothetical protein [Caenispirillum bisanense]SOD98869.1 hypothetical protein SAMN05421508_108116 [Caenispirillum bisanense]